MLLTRKTSKHQKCLKEQRKSKEAVTVLHFVNNIESSKDASIICQYVILLGMNSLTIVVRIVCNDFSDNS